MIPTKEEWFAALEQRHGKALQEKFSDATVAVCGLGGLGSNIAISLARAGIGKLILIDFDRVDITNLHRQQYKAEQIGRYKTDALAENLLEIAPYIDIETITDRITEDNMVASSELIRVIADRLRYYDAKNVVIDPVMVATSGAALMKNDAVDTLAAELLPISTLVTPNIPEAQVLSGLTIESKEDMIRAAKQIGDNYHCAVLLKGGHSINDASDLLYSNGELVWFEGERINNPNTHGTGCTLSSAIASNLAKGFNLSESVGRAKDYISGALAAMLDLGKGSGPMNHAFDLQGEYAREATR